MNTAFAKVNGYSTAGGNTASLLSYTLTNLVDGIVIGKVYSFKFRAANVVGYSPFSVLTRVGFGQRVSSPSTLGADLEQAGANYVTLVWSEVADADLPTLGYSLELLNDEDIWQEVFDARTNPNALTATITGLKTGKQYTFRAFAYNFNGKSLPSSSFAIYACGLPRDMAPPTYVISTKTSITIEWAPPTVNGGCPIFDFSVLRDADGTG